MTVFNYDNSSFESLITDNLHIVNSNAKKIFLTLPKGVVDEEDLVAEGVCALVQAAKTYNPNRESTFSHYIKLKTRGAMIDYLRKQDILSQQKRKEVKQFQKDLTDLESKLNRSASESEILQSLNLSKQQYSELIYNINMSSMVYVDSYEFDFLDNYLSSEQGSDELSDLLKSALDSLSKREQLLFQLYFYEDLNFKEIAQILEISPARISQIYSKAIIKLKDFINNHNN